MEEKVKNDLDLLTELSSMTSIAKTIELKEKKEEKEKKSTGFESTQEMNDYIQRRIDEALKKKDLSSVDAQSVVKNDVKNDYDNPRKASATGKHAGVSSFIQNFGTRGYGEERNAKGGHGGGKKELESHSKKTDSKIADSILKKLKEREKRSRNKKKDSSGEQFTFTRLGSINDISASLGVQNQQMVGTPVQNQQMVGTPVHNPQMVGTPYPTHIQTPKLFGGQSIQRPINNLPQHSTTTLGYNFITKKVESPAPNTKVTIEAKQKMLAAKEQRLLKMQQQLQRQYQQQQRQYQQQNQGIQQYQQPPPQHQQYQKQNQGIQQYQQPPPQQQQYQQPPPQQQQLQQRDAPPPQNRIENDMSKREKTPFVFILPAYDTGHLIAKVFDSIKSQTYTNYRIIYINDCSNDNTIQEVEKYKHENPNMNITLINNASREWPAYSRYVASKETNNDEVCIFLDGDDWLVKDDCLTTLNRVYKNKKIYATFGSMINAEWQYKKWKKYKRENVVNGGCYFPHLRTTRASIVKAISPYYMQTETNEWLHVCTDIALFMAVIEAVGEQGYVFLKNEFVHYNTKNHSNNSQEGYNNTKDSDMRLYYKNNIANKVPMKKIV